MTNGTVYTQDESTALERELAFLYMRDCAIVGKPIDPDTAMDIVKLVNKMTDLMAMHLTQEQFNHMTQFVVDNVSDESFRVYLRVIHLRECRICGRQFLPDEDGSEDLDADSQEYIDHIAWEDGRD